MLQWFMVLFVVDNALTHPCYNGLLPAQDALFENVLMVETDVIIIKTSINENAY